MGVGDGQRGTQASGLCLSDARGFLGKRDHKQEGVWAVEWGQLPSCSLPRREEDQFSVQRRPYSFLVIQILKSYLQCEPS